MYLRTQSSGGEAPADPGMDDAESRVLEAIARRPADPTYRLMLAQIRAERAMISKDVSAIRVAEAAYEEATKRAPAMGSLYTEYGAFELGISRFDRSIQMLEVATQLDPTDTRAWALLATAYRMTGQQEQEVVAAARAGAAKGR